MHFTVLGEVLGKGTVIGMILLLGTTSLWGCVTDSPLITAQSEGPKNTPMPRYNAPIMK